MFCRLMQENARTESLWNQEDRVVVIYVSIHERNLVSRVMCVPKREIPEVFYESPQLKPEDEALLERWWTLYAYATRTNSGSLYLDILRPRSLKHDRVLLLQKQPDAESCWMLV